MKRKVKLKKIVSNFLGESVNDLPYLSVASSSNQPMILEPAEDTSRPRGRPPKTDKVIKLYNDSEDTMPMVVNIEGEQQKRTKEKMPSVSPPPRKRLNKKQMIEKQQLEDKQDALIERQIKGFLKGESKAELKKQIKEEDKPKVSLENQDKPKPTHAVELVENKTKSWWKQQNIAFIKVQAELRGHRFSDLETKGGTIKSAGGVKKISGKFKKQDYLDVLFKILKI